MGQDIPGILARLAAQKQQEQGSTIPNVPPNIQRVFGPPFTDTTDSRAKPLANWKVPSG